MKKTIIIFTALSLVFVSVEAKKIKPNEVTVQVPVSVFSNGVDSMSYALGINVGTDFAKNIIAIPGGKSNIDLIIKGFTTAMKGDSALMTVAFANEYFKNFISQAVSKDNEVKKADGAKFLEANKTKEGVQTTASGLQYQVLKATEGTKPQATDSVKVHYVGTLIDGTKFDSSVDRGEPITFPLNQVIPGWTEGVQLMSLGSKYKFFVPYNLAYGEKGAGNGAIPGFATLIFEVELFDIKPVIQTPILSVVKPATEVKAVKQPKSNTGVKSTKAPIKKK